MQAAVQYSSWLYTSIAHLVACSIASSTAKSSRRSLICASLSDTDDGGKAAVAGMHVTTVDSVCQVVSLDVPNLGAGPCTSALSIR